MRPQEAQAPLKIERKCDGKTTIISLIGRIRSEDLDELKAQMDDKSERTILDLDDVTLVDALQLEPAHRRNAHAHFR